MADNFLRSAFNQSYFDDNQLTYSAQYFNELRDYALPFNLSAQQMFDLATNGMARYELQLIQNSTGMFAPDPYAQY